MTRPRLLDLFCGAGGCSAGYARVGFDVVGVDVAAQPNYPYEFHRADATTYPLDGFDAYHASPPCQGYTTMSNRWRGNGGQPDDWPKLIGPIRDAFAATGKPYVIENVPGARAAMRDPVTLHGGMFGLGVQRPRLFECSGFLPLIALAPASTDPVGVYGKAADGRRLFTRADGSEQRAASSVAQAGAAMGIDWMDWRELAEAIPPAYTEYLGQFLLQAIEVAA